MAANGYSSLTRGKEDPGMPFVKASGLKKKKLNEHR